MKYWLLIISLFTLHSCTVAGITNDYGKLTTTEQQSIIPIQDFSKTDTQHIYKISGSQLKKELANHPKSLVYVFTNGCTSKLCLPMSSYETFAKEKGYKLFLVMNGYHNISETTHQRSALFTEPLFAIDNDFYNSNIRMKYMRYFENDLRGLEHNQKPKWEGNLYFFEHGQLKQITKELPSNL
ncbi:hypothetical protein J2786_004238 [Chryseobacterium vietnamense]|uniref:Uncharacterized protein n=1 Tax=Chryseobacterium vietnamense TaxID=866785 RepID=A0ACC6JDA7_9FLAO|nr:hypothetical protein [Chryseobacterium vietnamense]MDR6461087.1 hypothetical protein [Chryseobacterium vietnamense]